MIKESDNSDGYVDDNKNSRLALSGDELGFSSEEESESDSDDKLRLYIILLIIYDSHYFCSLTVPKDKWII